MSHLSVVLAQTETLSGPMWWQWVTQPTPASILTGLALVAGAAILADIVAKQILLSIINETVVQHFHTGVGSAAGGGWPKWSFPGPP